MIYDISIDGTDLTNISNMEVTVNDLDKDSFRNAKGNLVRNRIAQIPEIKLTFGIQKAADMEALLELLASESFTVVYYLPHTQTTETDIFYAAPHTPKILIGNPGLYDKMEVKLIGYNSI